MVIKNGGLAKPPVTLNVDFQILALQVRKKKKKKWESGIIPS